MLVFVNVVSTHYRLLTKYRVQLLRQGLQRLNLQPVNDYLLPIGVIVKKIPADAGIQVEETVILVAT